MFETKPFYLSKTLLFNVFMMIVLIADQVPALWPAAPDWVAPAAATVLVVGNIILRVWFTEQPLGSGLK